MERFLYSIKIVKNHVTANYFLLNTLAEKYVIMKFLIEKPIYIVLGIVLVAILYFKNKRMNQKHEIMTIELLQKLKTKKIEAQAKYMKATNNKKNNGVKDFINYIGKMLFTLF